MELLLTPSNITFFIGLVTLAFSVYLYFKNPQTKLEKEQALTEQAIKSTPTIAQQKDTEKKAELIEQQVKSDRENNEKKFTEFAILLKDSLALAQNHIHTIDTKVDGLAVRMNDLEKGFVKLTTIIEERIPKK